VAPPVFKTGLAAIAVAGGFDSLPPPPPIRARGRADELCPTVLARPCHMDPGMGHEIEIELHSNRGRCYLRGPERGAVVIAAGAIALTIWSPEKRLMVVRSTAIPPGLACRRHSSASRTHRR
jgi:hypothetical protein